MGAARAKAYRMETVKLPIVENGVKKDRRVIFIDRVEGDHERNVFKLRDNKANRAHAALLLQRLNDKSINPDPAGV